MPDTLDEQLQRAQERLRELCDRINGPIDQPFMHEAIEQLLIALHELQVSSEELSEKAAQLTRSRELMDAERRRYRELFDFAPDGYLITNTDMVIQEANLAAASLLGVHRDFLIAQSLILFFPQEQRPPVRTLVDRLKLGGDMVTVELRLEPRDRPNFFAAALIAPMVDHKGRVVGLRWSFRDVSRIKAAESHALQSERLAAIGHMVAGLAHESRNAVQRSKACLDMLSLEVQDQPTALDLVHRLQKAQNDLHELHEHVRQYASPVLLERRTHAVDKIIRDVWQELDYISRHRQVTLLVDCEPVNSICEVDPYRLEQVFRNVLENSLAACSDPVVIRADWCDDEVDGVPALRVTIRDNGPGFSSDQREHLFQPFYTTKTRGTGLGLAISRRIVEAHGGQIKIGESGRHGAEIIIWLPRHGRQADMPETSFQPAHLIFEQQDRARYARERAAES